MIYTETFNPEIDSAALFTFLWITLIFSLLQLRINAIGNAAIEREEALIALRKIKTEQLDSSRANSIKPTQEEILAATTAYSKALEKELKLRTIMAGVKIIAPNDPNRTDNDISAAKQFLGIDLEEKLDQSYNQNPDTKKNLLLRSRRRFDGLDDIGNANSSTQSNLSFGSTSVLLGISIMLIALLFVLSFDPVTGESFFTWLDHILQS